MLLAWVTYFDEGSVSMRKTKPARGAAKGPSAADAAKQGASVYVRALDKDAEALAPAKVVSSKAISMGGVALARGADAGGAALAWVGKDAGLGQVFVTKITDAGDKQAQRMITHSKAGCSDVGLAAVADGFVVAWVESKDDRAEIFAAKVGKDIAKGGAERKVADARGEASDVRVTSRGGEVLVVWSEARAEGEGGIGAARLAPSDLTVRGDAMIAVPALRHARSVDVSPFGDGVELAWVEDAPATTADAGVGARALYVARLDAAARAAGRAAIPVAADPTSVAIDCERVCRVVVPVADKGELALYGFSSNGLQPQGEPRKMASLTGVSTEDTSPVIVKNWLFFAEDNLRGGGRIRKAKLVW